MKSFGRTAAIAGLWIFGSAVAVQAQEVRGQIRDAETGEPVAVAEVKLYDRENQLLGSTLTNDEGRFAVQAGVADTVRLSLSRLGYASSSDTYLELSSTKDLYLRLEMRPEAVAVEGFSVVAEAQPQSRKLREFYRNRRRGFGDFVEVSQRDRDQFRAPEDLLRRVPGLIVTDSRPPTVMRGGQDCVPTLFVDGVEQRWLGQPLKRIVDLEDLEAIEVYKSFVTTPIRWRSSVSCALLALWTR